MISCSTIINNLGLIADIIGAILLFKFGIPEKIDRDGNIHLIAEQGNENESKKAKRYDFWGNIGLGLLIFGFTLQFLSNFL